MDKIILSGFAGSGKTSIGTLIQEHLNYEFISVGNYVREIAFLVIQNFIKQK